MPVYSYRPDFLEHMDVKGLPDQVCIVLKPVGIPNGRDGENQSGAIILDSTQGAVGYLPVFLNYQDAFTAYPSDPIHIMDLTAYKEEMGFLSPKSVSNSA
jgi:hypothetical protein